MKKCSKCGKLVEENNKFCTSCGEKVEEEIKYCFECGEKLEKGERYCGNCGNDSSKKIIQQKVIQNPTPVKKESYILLIASLIVLFVMPAVLGLLQYLAFNVFDFYSYIIIQIHDIALTGLKIVGFVLTIISLIKYRKNKLAQTVALIELVYLAIFLIEFVVGIIRYLINLIS